MKRQRVTLEQIVDWSVLTLATARAARGKQTRFAVREFLADLDANLEALRTDLLSGELELGHSHRFQIHDPKLRTIHAPCFRERVLHHALMHSVGPILERTLIEDTFACRVGKGGHAAIRRTQQNLRRFAWYVKLDVRSYFASISHKILLSQIARKIKGRDVLDLIAGILASHEDAAGRGLPIGALTSQTFANFYLNGLDRFCLETLKVQGYVRYMDDFLCWLPTREAASDAVNQIAQFLRDELSLTLKQPRIINRSQRGVTVCGYRVFPGTIRLTARRKKRYAELLQIAEERYMHSQDARQLQMEYAAAHALTLHADAKRWRQSLDLGRADWYEQV